MSGPVGDEEDEDRTPESPKPRKGFKQLKGWQQGLLIVAIVAALCCIGAVLVNSGDKDQATAPVRPVATTSPGGTAEAAAATTEAEQPPSQPDLTMSQKQAKSKAESYLRFSAFSRSGLIKQLVFEGFDEADATLAVDLLGVDWKDQAAKKAKSYLDLTAFSHSGLVGQLEFEGFTHEEAEYGVSATGL